MNKATATNFGSGWFSGVCAVFLAALSFGAVLCLRFPALLTSPHLREVYPMPLIRALIQFVLLSSFVLGFISVILRKNKSLGLIGIFVATSALLLGGWKVPVEGPVAKSNYVGFDWFLLDLFLLTLVFLPLERSFPLKKEQDVLRPEWETDLVHFFVSHLLVQITIFLTLMPAKILFSWAVNANFQAWIASQNPFLQFLEIIFVADLGEYWIHRIFHRIPWMWRFHAVHHSSRHMDWLAASRLHLVDVILTRAITFIPLFILGFDQGPLLAYIVFVSFLAVFIHANMKFQYGWLGHVFATPRFHHWHHAAEPEARDKNFAVHLPLLDMLFGTFYLPVHDWPKTYGAPDSPVPESYAGQLTWPFKRK